MQEDSLDPTEEITLETVKERAVKGVVVLAGRTFILNVISLIATGLLTYFLDPEQFGVFWIVSAIVNFLYYFGDIGLAAALIQKKEKIEEIDLATTFTIQQILVVIILAILYFASPFIVNYYHLSHNGLILLYALAFSFLLSSLKTIPSVLLERELKFGRLVIPQVLENLFYNVTAVLFAWRGFGIVSFTYAVLIRAVVGLVAIYILRPWMPKIRLSKNSLKKLLTFGVPYQLNTFLATIKDDGLTAFLGGVLGTDGIGLLGWAQKWGQAPLRFFMDHVIKVTFPAFSRMQDSKDELKRSLERSIFFIAFLVFPTVAGLLIVAPILVNVIPRYSKWEPALVPLVFIAVNTVIAAVTTQLTNLLNSIGKIKTTFKLMIMWTALTWLVVPYMALRFGVGGAAFGYAVVGLSSFIAIYIVRKIVKFSLKASILPPLISSAVMGIVVFCVARLLPQSFLTILVLVLVGILTYTALIYMFVGRVFKDDVKRSFALFFSRHELS